jgi:capsular polysaccharide biosynthesis protein
VGGWPLPGGGGFTERASMGAADLHGHACRAHLCRRAPLVIALALVAALATVPVAYLHRGTPEYRARVAFVVHPASETPVRHVPDALRVLGDDGAVIGTVTDMLGSDRFVTAAAARARAMPALESMAVSTAHVARTDVVEVTVRGPSRDDVVAIARAMPATAQDDLARAFPSYEIDALGTAVNRASRFPPRPATLLLAFGAGLAAALAFALLEWAALRRAHGAAGPVPAPAPVVSIR